MKFRMLHKNKMYDVGMLDFENELAYMTNYKSYTQSSFKFDEVILMRCTNIPDKNGTLIFEGDILKVPVRRLSSSSWWRKTNKNHGFVGDYIYMEVKYKEHYDKYHNNSLGHFGICRMPITKIQVENIEKPRGREQVRQVADYINFDIEDCEVIGNIHQNPELTGYEEGKEFKDNVIIL